jgi:colicin import membrane protein
VTAQEILTRASEALEAAAARARAREAEILRQRAAALRALPRTPGIHDAATKPPVDFAALERQIAAKLSAAEQDAAAKARASEDDALSRWQAADADAYTKYTRAVDDARGAYIATIDTLQNAVHTVNAAEQARFMRDRAMAAAEAEYRSAKIADYDAYMKASAAAREQQIQSIERARQEANAARRAAADARDAQTAIATDATNSAGADVAAAIADAFAQQLARSKADAERDKADIFARMRADLAAIGQPI